MRDQRALLRDNNVGDKDWLTNAELDVICS